ncbi:MAG: NAD(P)/FAD-dependent oxidoreductase [Mesorhizobium sp.]
MANQTTVNTEPAPRIVVVGAGFAGLEVAKHLGRAGHAVTVVDRENHHLFQPLLYQVATAGLSAADIAEPIRKVLRGCESVQILLGEVIQIDTGARRIVLADGGDLRYDTLVLAAGAVDSYFGHEEWAVHARGMKTLADAQQIRSSVLLAFERAERISDPEEQTRLMTIAIVGGGPTGVELAGSLAELCRHTLAEDFRNIAPSNARIMLIEAGPRLLAGFSEAASHYAAERLGKLGVEVLTETAVEDVGAGSIRISGRTISVGHTLWAAGVKASPLAAMLGAETDKGGRVLVDETLAVPGLTGVFALGDLASCPGPDGEPLPGLAQVAKQQGRHLGRSLARHIGDGRPLAPFRYRGRGNTAIVGRNAAVFEQGRFKLRGWIAWLAWVIIHVYLLVGFQNRVQVSIQWFWRYLTYERGARLVTEKDSPKG